MKKPSHLKETKGRAFVLPLNFLPNWQALCGYQHILSFANGGRSGAAYQTMPSAGCFEVSSDASRYSLPPADCSLSAPRVLLFLCNAFLM